MRSRQLSLLPKAAYLLNPEHGGLLRPGRRKLARAVSTRDAMHVVLRSSRAKGAWSMLHPRHVDRIESQIRKIARKHGVRLYRHVNVGNHLHLLVRTPTRTAFKAFISELAGAIPMIVTGAKKGRALTRSRAGTTGTSTGGADAATGRGFWDYLPYTRIVRWGRDFNNVKEYFIKNFFEAAGLLTRKLKREGYEIIPMEGWVDTGPLRAAG
jgi:REP element-mobilizing transposase RayT